MKTVGIVLAGGLSRRFGSPKAFAELDGQYFYEYAVQALAPHCDDVIIVTRPEFVERFPVELNVITDAPTYRGYGPLAGIYSAMKNYAATRYIVLPCDMPYMNEDFIGKFVAHHYENMIAVELKGQYHPLVSILDRKVLPELKQALDEKALRVTPFLKKVQVKWVDGDQLTNDTEILLRNINYQNDLERSDSE